MSLHRGPRPSDRFAQIHNAALADTTISFRAAGVLAYLLSRPDGWSCDARNLGGGNREGRDAIRKALRELRDAGYIVETKPRDAQGRIRTESYVYDTPQT